ncbi:MAG: hypothetical protein BWK80_30380 [Desulfobacteraceae bacterium IS3]|nr:MAG: hypothetical protein BWK80_30380 [Desulfobacteraceae bacterium IS3]
MLLAKTVEITGTVNNQHQLLLDESLPIAESSRVPVIVIVTEEAQIGKSEAALKRDPEIIDALCGAFKNCLSSSDVFAKRKKEEIRLERTKWQKKQ